MACKLLQERQSGAVDVTYANGQFHYFGRDEDGTSYSWVKSARLSKSMLSYNRRPLTVQARHLSLLEQECADLYGGFPLREEARRLHRARFSSGDESSFEPSVHPSSSGDDYSDVALKRAKS